jgi:hypothetical protein
MKSESKERWTVSCRETTVQNKRVAVTSSLRDEKRFEACLHFEGLRVHSLFGLQAERILQEIADKWNQEGYAPKIIKGKLYLDMSTSEKLKLALAVSPPLPFTEEAAL